MHNNTLKHLWIVITKELWYVAIEDVQQRLLLFNFKIILDSQETEIVARIKYDGSVSSLQTLSGQNCVSIEADDISWIQIHSIDSNIFKLAG